MFGLRFPLRPLPLLTVVALLSLVVTGTAQAYDWPKCGGDRRTWNNDSVVYNPANISFPGSFKTALNRAAAAWNEVPGSQFRFNLVYDDATTIEFGDGKNSIGFTTDYDFGDFIAVEVTDLETCLLLNDGNIQESDILYNNDYTWESSLDPFFFSGSYNVALVGAHELGHGLGLGHENARLATMNSNSPNGGVFGNNHAVQIHADDALGSRVGYGTCCTRRDVAASVYEKDSGGHSSHIASPGVAERGHSTSFRFTLENRGTTSESSVRTNFYLSTNRFISTGDTFLGSATFSLGAGTTSTLSASVTIPLSVASGSYFLGVLADPSNSIAEVDESNNGAGLAGTVFVPSTSHPIACLSASPTSGTEPLHVTFDASCSSDPDGSITSYSWDFDDGSFGSGRTTSHTFGAGTYFVRLTVRDDDGLTAQSFVSIVVSGTSGCILCEEPI